MITNRIKLIILEELEYSGPCLIKDISVSETVKAELLYLLEKERLIVSHLGLISITEEGLNVVSFFRRNDKL
jgi:hypothetical protein